MSAPKDITRLVEQFDRNADAYRAPGYNETQLRREFIDPFCKCLGWDIDNTQGIAVAYKDVIHEDAIKVGGATKAPDYCFRVGRCCSWPSDAIRLHFVHPHRLELNV